MGWLFRRKRGKSKETARDELPDAKDASLYLSSADHRVLLCLTLLGWFFLLAWGPITLRGGVAVCMHLHLGSVGPQTSTTRS